MNISHYRYIEEYCYRIDHCHNTPLQQMAGFNLNNHVVEVTKDGNNYHVKVDNDIAEIYLDIYTAIEYIKRRTGIL